MSDIPPTDYSPLDRPEILMFLFHPRKESARASGRRPGNPADQLIPVDQNVVIGARFHMTAPKAPNILFFHGNGEIVSDYDELAPVYNRLGINFMPVDYRGYGRSSGSPTVTAMMRDTHHIFDFVTRWLAAEQFSGPLIVMGRSLGSAPALELARHYRQAIAGLVIESGFAWAGPLLKLLGVDPAPLGLGENDCFENAEKIRRFDRPVLIIHAEHDRIIPFSDARDLYAACPSPEKTLLTIRGAHHNDIFARGLSEYMQAIKQLVETISG